MIRILSFFSFKYFFKLIGYTLIFNYSAIAFNGIVSPEGSRYSSFLDQHLNFIQWIRFVIMTVSNAIANYFNTHSYISGQQLMKLDSGVEVEIWLPCLGLGIISFWIAFIITNSGNWRKKFIWCIGGIACITLINCWRISFLLISLDREWQQIINYDHHDLFNIVAYIFIAVLMYSYTENSNDLFKNKHISTNI